MLLEIIKCIKSLAHQGIPLRNDNEEDGNFIQLLNLKEEMDERVIKWLKKLINKYTSKDVQNELLQIMALFLLRKITNCIWQSVWYTIMLDEVTDSANKEQFMFVLDG